MGSLLVPVLALRDRSFKCLFPPNMLKVFKI